MRMSSIDIEIDEATLKELVRTHMSEIFGTRIEASDIQIRTKSKQNYKSEWEVAAFKAVIHKNI
jgi:predicted component of type VI protein secretion system